jgi:hypothetical protein
LLGRFKNKIEDVDLKEFYRCRFRHCEGGVIIINRCDRCNADVPIYQRSVNYSSGSESEHLCSECFSMETALRLETAIDYFEPSTYEVQGKGKKKHTFYIDRLVFYTGISLEAREIKRGKHHGYRFAVRGELTSDCDELLKLLLDKVEKGVKHKYLKLEYLGPVRQHHVRETELAGNIEWDDQYDGDVPLFVIDGKEISLVELGRMLMSFEGWAFNLTITAPEDAP